MSTQLDHDTAHVEAAPSARRLATRDRLLHAATEVFAETGLQAASVESICQRAGFTRGAFYSNFSTKEELFLALLEQDFARRAADLERKTAELTPAFAGRGGNFAPDEAVALITQFFGSESDGTTWHVLETEFALLAMRDPESAPGYTQLVDSWRSSMTRLVVAALDAAGRHFTLPAGHALAILCDEAERALRATALSGPDAPGAMNDLPALIGELLFAITEPVGT